MWRGYPSSPRPIIPPSLFEETSLEPPLGSPGPYIVDKIAQGHTITYRRNPDYWAKDLAVVIRGRFNFDTIRFEYFRDCTAEHGGPSRQEPTISPKCARSSPPRSGRWNTTSPAIRAGKVKKRRFADETPSGTQGFFSTRGATR